MDKEKQKRRLLAISEKEWTEVVKKLTCYVHNKLFGKTLYGAHSEKELGVNAVDYYVTESLSKLYNCDWEWKQEYNLTEQLIRIAGSMISANVEKYKTRAESNKNIDFVSIESDELLSKLNNLDDEEYSEEEIKIFENILYEASQGDEELELLVLALPECSSFDEIESMTNIPKGELYTLFKKLKRKCVSIRKKNNYEN